MKAEWAMLASQLANNEPAPWKNIWWHGIRDAYGPLCDAVRVRFLSCLGTVSYQIRILMYPECILSVS